MSRDPFFRLNFNFEIPRPAPTAVARDENPVDDTGENDIETEHREHEGVVLIPRKTDKKGWIRTAREHPRFSLRLISIIALIVGLSFNGFVVDNYYDWRIDSLSTPAIIPVRSPHRMCKRSFRRRKVSFKMLVRSVDCSG